MTVGHQIATALLPMVAALVVACDGPSRNATISGDYILEIALPKTVWSTNEAIQGEATLSLTTGMARDLGGSGSGLILFGFEEVAGTRVMPPAMTDDCQGYRIAPDAPLRRSLKKSGGGWPADDPDAAFYEAFRADPQIRLPPGQWRIRAIATFSDTGDCGAAVTIDTSIDIRVVP